MDNLESTFTKIFEEVDKINFLENHPLLAICVTDKSNHILWVNNSFIQLTGYPKEELFNQPFDLVRGHSSKLLEYNLQRAKEEKITTKIKLQIAAKSGRQFFVNGEIKCLNDDYYYYSFSFYSERAKVLLNSMTSLFQLLTGNIGVLFIKVEEKYPHLVKLITNNSFFEIGQDFELIQNQSILKFLSFSDGQKLQKAFTDLSQNTSNNHLNDLEILEITWNSINQKKLLKMMIQLDKSDKCFYIIASPLKHIKSIQKSQETLNELKELSSLPDKAFSKIQILEENLKYQKTIDEFHEKQVTMICRQIDDLMEKTDTLSSQLAVIYSDTVNVIQAYKNEQKNKQARLARSKQRLLSFATSPLFLPMIYLLFLLILQIAIALLPEVPFLSKLEQKAVDFLLNLFE